MAIHTISFKDFMAGESYGDFAPTAGFSPNSYGLNLTKNRGVLHFTENQTDRGGATLTGNIVASTDDLSFLGNDKYFIDDGGAVYTLSGSTLTKRQTINESAGGNFTLGTTDMIQFKLVTYITSDDAIHKLTGSNLSTTANWWNGLVTSNRHPLEVVENNMFIGDGNTVYFWNGTSSGVAFTLPTENKITSLRKHSDGKTLLAFTGKTANFSHTKPSAGRVYYLDPTLIGAAVDGWSREVELEAQVEGTRIVGGVVYCTWGKNFGFFDGSGLTLIKKLDISSTTYSHSISSIEETLLVRDGRFVLSFGDLGSGSVWHKMARNNGLANINVVASKGDNVLLFGDAGSVLREIDFDNAGANGTWYSDRIDFGREVQINRIEILHDKAITYQLTVTSVDLAGAFNTIEQIIYSGASIVKSRIDCDIKSDIFQLNLSPGSGTIGIKAIRIFYDPI